MAPFPNVFTIPAGADFLDILADHISAQPGALSDWTILLPTRRAVTEFRRILRMKSGRKALLLPRVAPLGDLDEDRLQDDMIAGDLPKAMSSTAVLLELSRLAKEWAAKYPDMEFAQEIAASPVQALGLARSLADFITTVETQDGDLTQLPTLYDNDLAEHREAIIKLLELVSKELPDIHKRDATMGAAARRSAMLRLEAQRIMSGAHKGPIIAAGSTGTIPATRDLLNAIARHPKGAVVLPGLDQLADEASWAALPPEHPQYALQQLLGHLEIRRSDVKPMGPAPGPRNRLASELTRPTATASHWHETLPARQEEFQQAISGLCEIAAADRHEEARAIALIMRETLEHKGRRAILVTPDRDLAARVTQELKRWNIDIADSYGRPLSQTGMGLALGLLLQAALDGFTPESTMAFLRHPLMRLDRALLQQFEVAVLRGRLVDGSGFAENLKQAETQHARDPHHAHPLLKRMTEDDWRALQALAAQIDAVADLRLARPQLFGEQLKKIIAALESVTDPESWDVPLRDFLGKLQDESWRLKSLGMAEAALILRTLLHSETVATSSQSHPRLAILGTLEARLMTADVMILGSLNETIWPAQTDPGPWLNRKMRTPLNLPQPERDIGLAAHDFEQGFSQPKVYLTWSKRIGHAPAQASRWLLRLDAVLQVANVKRENPDAGMWLNLAQSFSVPDGSEPLHGPMPKPAFAPPVEARPRRFSATEVERLIRNPYAIYARKILKLEPLPDFIAAPSPALRGTIFHEAIGDWNKQQAPGESVLLSEGEKQFAAFGLDAALKSFWLPHFRKVAAYLATLEHDLKQGGITIHAELSGKHEFEVDGLVHTLTARADRIDLLKGGEVRIIDYKTGKPPSVDQVEVGLNPQMTLEAAILKEGGFGAEFALPPREALYIRIGRGRDALDMQSAVGGKSVGLEALSQQHFAGFKSLLRIYLDPATPYLPRLRSEKDEADEDYDHLSRYLEWQLAP